MNTYFLFPHSRYFQKLLMAFLLQFVKYNIFLEPYLKYAKDAHSEYFPFLINFAPHL